MSEPAPRIPQSWANCGGTSTRASGSGEETGVAATSRISLRAGPLTMVFDGGDLRYIELGRREIVRRIHAAVRDRNWGTVPATISHLQGRIARESFQIGFVATHRRDDIHFVWRAEISGRADGTVRFSLDGEAQTTFLRNRVGFCVLHPAECAGARCRVERVDGPPAELVFPRLVEPAQPIPGIHDLTAFAHEAVAGVWAELRFSGDRFEMEDQRNWIDASFKTYCTPLHLPFPVEVPAGTRIRQEILLQLVARRSLPAPARRAAPPIRIAFPGGRHRLPTIGLGRASHRQPLSAEDTARLGHLRPAHLRVDVGIGEPDEAEALHSGIHEAAQLRIPLELAVHLPPEGGGRALAEVVHRLDASGAKIARVLLFRRGEKTVSAAGVALARPHLAPLGAPIGAGTDADFYQLNQHRPPHSQADFVHWSMNPQVHAYDLASIAETPAAIVAQIETARVFFLGKPLVVSPLTLKPRFNPVATAGEKPAPAGELPAPVDARQLSPFAAAWTLAVLKHLAESGADSVTLFETTGWRGVLERASGTPLPAAFPSRPGQLFPLYHVLAELGAFVGGEVIATHCNAPLRVVSLALTRSDRACLLLANLGERPETVRIAGPRRISRAQRLDWTAADGWMRDPQFVSRLPAGPEPNDRVELPPFGLARLELA